ncbi:hypothetical protein [Georgenia sp. Z1491]|uniref:hypothetical protein n=1 Tax=Georgenia sp. Z1491 TaxID=3416707 RepID=UPI003CEF92C0
MGLVGGLAGGWFAFAGEGSDAPGETGASAEVDARRACEIVDTLPESFDAEQHFSGGPAALFRFEAMSSLAQAAGSDDDRYAELASAAEESSNAAIIGDWQTVDDSVVAYREACSTL